MTKRVGGARLTGVAEQRGRPEAEPNLSLGRCALPKANGGECQREADPRLPWQMCREHALKVYEHVRAEVQDATARMAAPQPMRDLERRVNNALVGGVVYWLQIGALIKVGYTSSLKMRLAAYPPDRKVLALEPDATPELERERIDQFAHLCQHGREWLKPAPDLVAFLNTLRPADKQMDLARFDLEEAV